MHSIRRQTTNRKSKVINRQSGVAPSVMTGRDSYAVMSEANLLIDYDDGHESDEEEEILFEDLADIEID